VAEETFWESLKDAQAKKDKAASKVEADAAAPAGTPAPQD